MAAAAIAPCDVLSLRQSTTQTRPCSAAADRGCAGVVAACDPPEGWSRGFVRVGGDDAGGHAALTALARAVRRGFGGPVLAVTGSVGKTTTCAMAALALSPLGAVHKTAGNLNNEVEGSIEGWAGFHPCSAARRDAGPSRMSSKSSLFLQNCLSAPCRRLGCPSLCCARRRPRAP